MLAGLQHEVKGVGQRITGRRSGEQWSSVGGELTTRRLPPTQTYADKRLLEQKRAVDACVRWWHRWTLWGEWVDDRVVDDEGRRGRWEAGGWALIGEWRA